MRTGADDATACLWNGNDGHVDLDDQLGKSAKVRDATALLPEAANPIFIKVSESIS